MREFVKMAGAVMIGTLAASGVAMKVVMNEKFLKMYTKKALEVSKKIAEEIENEEDDYLD